MIEVESFHSGKILKWTDLQPKLTSNDQQRDKPLKVILKINNTIVPRAFRWELLLLFLIYNGLLHKWTELRTTPKITNIWFYQGNPQRFER